MEENDNTWTVVNRRRRTNSYGDLKAELESLELPSKIPEPCWFYNNGGCRNKDGTDKVSDECKYIHMYSDGVKRPPHLNSKKPCDRFNLEGDCRWYDSCKYSHRNLTPEEWIRHYPGIPYTLKTHTQKRVEIENKLMNLSGRIQILEFKQDGIYNDVKQLESYVRQLINKIQTP